MFHSKGKVEACVMIEQSDISGTIYWGRSLDQVRRSAFEAMFHSTAVQNTLSIDSDQILNNTLKAGLSED